MEILAEIDWYLVADHMVHLALAYAVALPIAWERERTARSAGLRTFPLVAMGSCGYVLIGLEVLSGSTAHARILYGLMTGIGFIGGGAIIRDGGTVRGTATAASIWITGAFGAAIAWHRYEIALVLSIVTFMTLRFVQPVKGLAAVPPGLSRRWRR